MIHDNGTKEHSPVFIVGAYRSGTSALTWSLGQHPNIYGLPETHWIARLAIDMNLLFSYGTSQGMYTHLGGLGWSKDDFYRYFGDAVDRFVLDSKEHRLRFVRQMARNRNAERQEDLNLEARAGKGVLKIERENDPKGRWVDGTPENSMHMFALSRLFPNAKFIHILRNPDSVAKSLMNFSNAGEAGVDFSEKAAYREWMRLVGHAALGERALGSDRVLRIHQENLAANPENTIADCLKFLDEPFSSRCLDSLRVKVNSSNVESGKGSEPTGRYATKARLFYEKLLEQERVPSTVDSAALQRLEDEFDHYVNQVDKFKRYCDYIVGWERKIQAMLGRPWI